MCYCQDVLSKILYPYDEHYDTRIMMILDFVLLNQVWILDNILRNKSSVYYQYLFFKILILYLLLTSLQRKTYLAR